MPELINRLHYMDAMRAVLMMLGVVLHSAQVFNADQSWLIYSADSSALAQPLIVIISMFRMPAFFLVSGFFCCLTLCKYPLKTFARLRLTRIIVPFVVTALTLNTLQSWLLNYSNWQTFELSQYLSTGGYISHLWFLVNLAVYFTFSAVLVALASRPIAALGRWLEQILWIIPMIFVLLLLPLLSIAILGLNKIGFPLYSDFFGLINVYILLKYLPYFIVGVLLGMDGRLLQRFATLNPLLATAMIIFCQQLVTIFPPEGGLAVTLATTYLSTLMIWFSASLCFNLFYRFFNQPSQTYRYLSEASYTVYLFHHLVVIALGLCWLQLGWPADAGLMVLVFLTLAITLLIHRFAIQPNQLLRYLFNGK